MKRIVIYAETEALARRSRMPREDEIISYRSIDVYNKKDNQSFDEVVVLSEINSQTEPASVRLPKRSKSGI